MSAKPKEWCTGVNSTRQEVRARSGWNDKWRAVTFRKVATWADEITNHYLEKSAVVPMVRQRGILGEKGILIVP